MNNKELAEIKNEAFARIPWLINECMPLMSDADSRILQYCRNVLHEGGEIHNVYEVLSVVRFLERVIKYTWNNEAVQRFFNMYEMLKFNGADGRQRHKLSNVQAFQFANMFGLYKEDGTRLCRNAILFVPRKFGKTTSVASLAVNDFLFGDDNAQAYMASNSLMQSTLCYDEARSIIEQLDPQSKRFRVTAGEITWKRNRAGKESSITRLTAGAKTKDGLNASLVIFDEYAAARYVKDHSDGAELLNVLTSSMGTRAEPMTVIITTANRVNNGPFEIMLNAAKDALVNGGCDWQFASVFQPDPWDIESGELGSDNVWRKCNPHIGVTVREGFYASEWEEAQRDEEKRKEFLCKYLNVFQSEKRRDWIPSADISGQQTNKRIDDINPKEGRWDCFVGMDFSRGDDLCGMAYLCYNHTERSFFVDCDAWITHKSLTNHTNSTLYKSWANSGWLHVCKGDVIPESIVTDRMSELVKHVRVMRIGYDPYDARSFVNMLEGWLRGMRVNPGSMVRPVRQTWGQFNSACQTFERLVGLRSVTFSQNPIIPWCFGNAVLEEDKFENVKPVKRTANGKIDIVICILEGIIMMDEMAQRR